jgi:LEA14-like dessication related protein
MYKLFQPIVLLLSVVLLTACAGGLPLQSLSPQVSLADFKMVNSGLLEQKYRIRLRLKNPNPIPLPIAGLNYQLNINEQKFTSGVSNQAITIPASGEEYLEFDVASNLTQIVGNWSNLQALLDRKFNYQLTGGLNVMEGAPQLPFEYKGDISLLSGDD